MNQTEVKLERSLKLSQRRLYDLRREISALRKEYASTVSALEAQILELKQELEQLKKLKNKKAISEEQNDIR